MGTPRSPAAERHDLQVDDAEGWRSAVSAAFVPLLTETSGASFTGRIETVERGDVQFSSITADPHRVVRTAQLAGGSDRPYYKVSVQLSGSQLLVQDGREAMLTPGDLAIYDSARPYTLASTGRFSSLVVMFPRDALGLPTAAVGTVTGTRLGTDRVGGLVGRLLSEVGVDLDPVAEAGGSRLVGTLLGLVSTAVAEHLDLGRPVDAHRSLAERARDYIEQRLTDPDLRPEEVAAAHFVSPRHLQKVFQDEGETVTGWIRSRRLQRCREDLADPAHASRPVSAIGARWGFVDPAHFSRTFRTAVGSTPGKYRERWLPT